MQNSDAGPLHYCKDLTLPTSGVTTETLCKAAVGWLCAGCSTWTTVDTTPVEAKKS